MKRLLALAALLFTAGAFAGSGFSEYFVLNETDETIQIDLGWDDGFSLAPKQEMSIVKVYRTGLLGTGPDWTGMKNFRVIIPSLNNVAKQGSAVLGAIGKGGYTIDKAPWYSHSGIWHRHSYPMGGGKWWLSVDCWQFGSDYDFKFVINKEKPKDIGTFANTPA